MFKRISLWRRDRCTGGVRFLVFGVIALFSISYGQPDTLWTRQYVYPPYFKPTDVLWDAEGNILVSGNLQGPTSLDMFILKLSNNGDSVSLARYGPQDTDEEAGAFLRRAVGGGYALAGNARLSNLRDDFYLARLDESGTLLWERTYGVPENSEDFGGFAATQDGGFILVGDGHWGNWPLAVRVDANGDTLWDREYRFTTYGMAEAIVQTPDGGFAMTGFADTEEASIQVFFAKLDSAGNLSNLRFYGGETSDEGADIISVSSGGFLIAGYSNSYSDAVWDLFVLRLNDNGDSLWAQIIPCGIFNVGKHCRELIDGSFIILSQCLQAGYYHFSLTHLTSIGELIWQREYRVGNWFSYAGLDIDFAGHYLMCTRLPFDTALVVLTEPDTTLSAIAPPTLPRAGDISVVSYPNPFNTLITIDVRRKTEGLLTIRILDILGRVAAILATDVVAGMECKFVHDASSLSTGIYFIQVTSGEQHAVAKILLVK